jgi:ribonuclease P protein component
VDEKSLQDAERKAESDLPSLPGNLRIKKNTEFREIFRSGERRTGEHLSIIYIRKKGFKFGITFRREAKPAVKRNRAKRRITHMIRSNKQLLKKDIHMVVHIPKSGIGLSFGELEGEFLHLLMEAHILE